MHIDDLAAGASAIAEAMGRLGFKRIAVVREESGRWDQAFLSPGGAQILIRWAAVAAEADAMALQTIAAQGPFDRIFYVFDEGACEPGQGFTAASTADFPARAGALFG